MLTPPLTVAASLRRCTELASDGQLVGFCRFFFLLTRHGFVK